MTYPLPSSTRPAQAAIPWRHRLIAAYWRRGEHRVADVDVEASGDALGDEDKDPVPDDVTYSEGDDEPLTDALPVELSRDVTEGLELED